MSKFLILGASGLLGTKLVKYLHPSHGTFFTHKLCNAEDSSFLDTSNIENFRSLLEKVKPDVVINCTGLTSVDLCEQFPEKSWKLNCWQALLIAQECRTRSVKYVHISTDHFLNLSEIKLKEHDKPSALNQYGYSKLNAENYISYINNQSLIVRCNFFHFNTHSPVTFFDHLFCDIRNRKIGYSFNDVIFTPVSTFQLATYIVKLIEIDFAGIINISSTEEISKFDFHEIILTKIKAPSGFHMPVLLNSINRQAKRPHYMALDNNLLQTLLGVKMPSIYDMIDTELRISN